MNVVYPVIFTETNDKDNTILVYIPDLDGMTEGHGIADSIAMAKDYIGNSLFDRVDAEFPVATAMEDMDVSASEFVHAGKSYVSLVDVDMDLFRRMRRNRNIRRNITLPEWLDEMATRAKINVSAVTQSALKEKLGLAP